MNKTKDEWKEELKPEVFHILWEKGTEPAFSGKNLKEKRIGTYLCAGCGNELFKSNEKFDSGSGWPSFSDPYSKDSVDYHIDLSHGLKRVEVLCKKCGGHLGHVFDDGPKPSKKRFCMNSLALRFVENK